MTEKNAYVGGAHTSRMTRRQFVGAAAFAAGGCGASRRSGGVRAGRGHAAGRGRRHGARGPRRRGGVRRPRRLPHARHRSRGDPGRLHRHRAPLRRAWTSSTARMTTRRTSSSASRASAASTFSSTRSRSGWAAGPTSSWRSGSVAARRRLTLRRLPPGPRG